MQRIYVVGSSCAGKTTLAAQIAAKLSIPHHELDYACWLPGWKLRSKDEMREKVGELAAGEQWVMCGNWGKVRDLIAARCDTIIWLNFPFRIVLWRCITRTLHRLITKQEVCNGNVEHWRNQFASKDSIIWFVITTYHRRNRFYRGMFDGEEWNQFNKVELRHPREAKQFLERIGCSM